MELSFNGVSMKRELASSTKAEGYSVHIYYPTEGVPTLDDIVQCSVLVNDGVTLLKKQIGQTKE